jgi:2-oxoglutarate ferredoxin oxidoreductase subunit beta
VFRDVPRTSYDRLMGDQLAAARERQGRGDLASLLAGNDTWTVA